MNLDSNQIARFHETGYITLPEFYSAQEVAAMRAELERLKRAGKLRNVATEGDGKTPSHTMVNLQLCPMSPHSPLFRAMPFDPKVIAAVRQLIGDPVVLHLDQVFLKPGRHGSGTAWHQDNAYFRIADPLKGTAMWVAVHDATVANGTLHLIPGSFRIEYAHSRDPYSDHHIRCYPDETQAVPIKLPAGGVAFFAYGTVHCTQANSTDHERAGVALHFVNGDVLPPDYFRPDDLMRHPFLTGPQADDGLSTYGECMTSAWTREVHNALTVTS
ncbi:MAG: phytanoyl-CoA dioxygenase family protein [Chloroherpetonaceae bacterium]|nr:phytanoyl-CoA dioxygenase family protein [Chthonomonadaceae bacterium]MDW8206422.1 phytanoyl-CoA dioxygenase family protein [Chloroherpetonaceae bacterium]